MSNCEPLTGTELLDCAKASASQGLEAAAKQCGYDEDTEGFTQALQAAGQHIGVEINALEDLITDQQQVIRRGGVEVAPETPSDL